MENLNKTFVYDGTEVVRTGRIAKASNVKAGAKPHISQILIEIKPLDKDIEWKKWVKQSELFEIDDGLPYFNDQQVLIENGDGGSDVN